ncbi:hypothetical protein QBC34DRAFT_422929 [Podospora aff. communis PSN243]|uniref:RRM domain-containing protein n=1 Tax=Podospora aff. communis PSN243 TaxID=3040156 RepID=A0AAV9GY99_9PEZI|nr:hypothetical protein QBC34DRAFT_422929 [Podospora aff. communis PSN243]
MKDSALHFTLGYHIASAQGRTFVLRNLPYRMSPKDIDMQAQKQLGSNSSACTFHWTTRPTSAGNLHHGYCMVECSTPELVPEVKDALNEMQLGGRKAVALTERAWKLAADEKEEPGRSSSPPNVPNLTDEKLEQHRKFCEAIAKATEIVDRATATLTETIQELLSAIELVNNATSTPSAETEGK